MTRPHRKRQGSISIAPLRYCWSVLPILMFGAGFLCAQPRTGEYSISGVVVDSLTGGGIEGGIVRVEPVGAVATTDADGRFRIDGLSDGAVQIEAKAPGFVTQRRTLRLEGEEVGEIIFRMGIDPLTGSDVVVHADRISGGNSVSDVSLDVHTLRKAQGLVQDPLRTVATLPGVTGGLDLFNPSQIYVRGGAPEETLFLLDKVKLYWPWYFGGIKSVYNLDVIDRVELSTGGFSAAFGNHLSSVLNVTTRDGDFSDWHGGFSFGFFNAGAHIEGPVIEDEVAVLAAVRRTYLDLFLDESAEFPVPSFGDITYKGTWRPGSGHRIRFSGFSSDESMDFLAAEPEPGLPDRIETDGNIHAQSLEWLALIGDRLVSRLVFTHSQSNSRFAIGRTLDAAIDGQTWGVRHDGGWQLWKHGRVEFGGEGYLTDVSLVGTFPLDPSETDPNDTTILLRPYDVQSASRLGGAYLLYNGELIQDVEANAGMRVDLMKGADAPDISPRLALSWNLSDRISLRTAFGEYRQFPDDEALQYNPDLTSALARHYIAGLSYVFSPSMTGWIEGYVKDYSSLTYYDSALTYRSDGTGLARGIEIFFRKNEGPVTGWTSLAFSRAERQGPLQDGVYRFDYDIPVVFNCALAWQADSVAPWYLPSVVSGQLRYASGRPYTPVINAVQTPEGWRPRKGETNSAENPDYMNVNLRLEWHYPIGTSVRAASFVEIWNLTDSRNVLGRTYRYGAEFPANVMVQPYYTTPLIAGGGFLLEF